MDQEEFTPKALQTLVLRYLRGARQAGKILEIVTVRWDADYLRNRSVTGAVDRALRWT
jgi:hypothetical protein